MTSNSNEKAPVILYGAGRNAERAYKKAMKMGLNPVAFVDKNPDKWGKPAYENCPLIVCSLEDIQNKYDSFRIFVSVADDDSMLKYAILEYLVEDKGISPEHIINYEPYVHRISCGLFENTIAPLGERDVGLCRGGRLINVTKMPTVEWLDDPAETLDNFLAMRRRLLDEIQENVSASPCNGCIVLREQAWPKEYRIKNYVLSTEPKSVCQFKCIYCYSGHYGNNSLETRRAADITIDKRVDLLLELEKRGFADPSFTVISLSDGEICVDPKRANLYKLTERYNSMIYTNAGVYGDEIASLIRQGRTTIVVSVDAGTCGTFKKIKGADAYEKVCNNLQKYAAINPECIILQYIYLPGENDSAEDIDGFLNLCNEIKPKKVYVLLDVLSDKNLLEDTTLDEYFVLLDKILLSGFDIFTGANVFLNEPERKRLWEIAESKKDEIIRDDMYYKRLKTVLEETVY